MQFIKLLLSFAPWLAFLIIAHDSMFRLKLGLLVAFTLTIVMGVLRLHRGVILWAGVCFFTYATIAVVFFEHAWTIRHMGILANGALALSTWYTIAIKKPFTEDYAREHTPPSLWNNPVFIRTNLIIASIWGGSFTFSAFIAWHKMAYQTFPDWQYELTSYSAMLASIVFTNWYPLHIKRQRADLPNQCHTE